MVGVECSDPHQPAARCLLSPAGQWCVSGWQSGTDGDGNPVYRIGLLSGVVLSPFETAPCIASGTPVLTTQPDSSTATYTHTDQLVLPLVTFQETQTLRGFDQTSFEP